jgi:hypothetical protein
MRDLWDLRAVATVGITLASGLLSQTPDMATLHGHVTDQTHASLAGVDIKVTNSLTRTTRSAQTDGGGDFTLAGLPVAPNYRITAEKQGFAQIRSREISLGGGATADVNLEMNVAGGTTQVAVTGVSGEVRTDAPQIGDRIIGQQLAETPMLNRRITYLPLLNSANRPAINQGDVFMNQVMFTTNGAGRREAWFEVDGSTGNDAWGRQTIFTNIPLAAVQEMTVLENSFSAEYGGSAGSAVNIVTRSGGKRLRAVLIETWRPSATQAALSGFSATNAASGNDITSDRLGQTSLSLGGPVGSGDQTYFFAAGEFSRQDRASPIISPVAPGSFVGHYRDWLGFLRFDRQINNGNSLFLRSNLDGFHDTNPNGAVGGNNLPSVDRVFRRRTYSAELGETAVFSPTLINTVRLQFQLASPITEFDPVIYGVQYQVPISTGGAFTSGTSQSALLMNRQYQFSDTVSAVRGRHVIKFGGGAIAAHTGGNSKEFGGPIYLGQFVYNTCTQSLAFCESSAYLGNIANVRTYTQSYGNANYTVNDFLWSGFVQDDYRLRPDLTLNLGVRYERQTFTDFNNGFAPRIGFCYNWRGDGNTVIHGGFGIYYSQVVDNSEANYALTGPTGVFNYSAAPGQVGFPSSVTAVPLPAFPAGAPVPLRSLYIRPGDSADLNQFFPTSTLLNYPSRLLNPYSEQWVFGIERKLIPGWVFRVDYVGSHTLRINRPLDVDPPTPFIRNTPGQVRTPQAANCTRPYWIFWYSLRGLTCDPNTATNPQPPYSVIQSDVNNGYAYYNALQVNLTGRVSRRLTMLASYTWSHTIDNVDPDVPGQNPNDPHFAGKVENANAIFDQRHRFVLSGVWLAPWGLHIGGVTTLASGLPFNYTTGITNSGDTGATTDRPVINGVVIGRNTGRGTAVYDVSPLVERPFILNEHLRIEPRIEVFNLLNHANFVGFSGIYGNGPTPGPGFGQPLAGITNQLPARSVQFSIKLII